jgi:deoxyribodipyrimidine photolyase-related protein
MSEILLLFPNQLYRDICPATTIDCIYLVEEYLFFNQYKFHKQKLVFHRASMKYYQSYLESLGHKVQYVEAIQEESDVRKLLPFLKSKGCSSIDYYDTTDYMLERRLHKVALEYNLTLTKHNSQLFINTSDENIAFFKTKKRYYHADYYMQQRRKLDILVDDDGKPEGGKWSFDAENRLKYPKNKEVPCIKMPKLNAYMQEAVGYIKNHYPNNLGEISSSFIYPTTHDEAQIWLENFLKTRFDEFGLYEDAMVKGESILNHSVLTPMLNVGLISSKGIVDAALSHARAHGSPLNTLEGFIRQIIGWREYIRAVYDDKGVEERTKNYWGFKRKIPKSFYDGSTGIVPVDDVIKRVLATGYCHHIERLMVLGNFMLLCEFDPDEVYRWFMELFIDAYDWVMVPNVYGMSQFADGGLMATKPYISGSNYIMKMSNYEKGDWQATWDGLFWRFMDKQRSFFLQNPRLGMLIRTFDKMSDEKKQLHHGNAEKFLTMIDNEQ